MKILVNVPYLMPLCQWSQTHVLIVERIIAAYAAFLVLCACATTACASTFEASK
jgi:hypothetical protein